MDYGIMPLWELRETLSAFWRDGDFGEDFRQAYYVWEIRSDYDGDADYRAYMNGDTAKTLNTEE